MKPSLGWITRERELLRLCTLMSKISATFIRSLFGRFACTGLPIVCWAVFGSDNRIQHVGYRLCEHPQSCEVFFPSARSRVAENLEMSVPQLLLSERTSEKKRKKGRIEDTILQLACPQLVVTGA